MNEKILRRIGVTAGVLGALLLFLGGLTGHGGGNTFSFVGIALAVVSFAVAVVVHMRPQHWSWFVLLGLAIAWAAVTSLLGLAATGNGLVDLAFIFMPLTLIGWVSSSSASPTVAAGGVIAVLAGLSIATVILSGTFAAGGGTFEQKDLGIVQMGSHLYVVAAGFGAAAWVLGMILALKVKSWGWFITDLLLFNVGAFMFGLFGPTAEDIRQSRAQRASRRAAGIR